jgi:hypothetical protein
VSEQCTILGDLVTKSNISDRRRMLLRCGHILSSDRAVNAIVTDTQRDHVLRLYKENYSFRAIAVLTELGFYRVSKIIRNANEKCRITQRSATYTHTEVERVFGGSTFFVRLCLQMGWLPRQQVASGLRHRFTQADILALVRIREAWIVYTPAQITDPDIRRAAELARAAELGQWYSMKMLAVITGVHANTVRRLYRRGEFRAYTHTTVLHEVHLWIPDGWDTPTIDRIGRTYRVRQGSTAYRQSALQGS